MQRIKGSTQIKRDSDDQVGEGEGEGEGDGDGDLAQKGEGVGVWLLLQGLVSTADATQFCITKTCLGIPCKLERKWTTAATDKGKPTGTGTKATFLAAARASLVRTLLAWKLRPDIDHARK